MQFGSYRPDDRGLTAIGRSTQVQQGACVPAAEQMASRARADDPIGDYRAEPAPVLAGWDNELRAGARVIETKRGDGARRRTLARMAARRS